MKRFCIAILMASVTGAAEAQAAGEVATDAETARLNALTLEQAFSELRADMDEFPVEAFYWLARKSLVDLYYPIDLRTPFEPLDDAATMESIRQFEARIGVAPDGILALGEYSQLQSYAQLSSLTRLFVGGTLSVSTIGESVFASGTWKLENELPAYPINHSEIVCSMRYGECTDTFTQIDSPRLRDGKITTNQYQVFSGKDTYQIDKWEGGVVEASSTGGCRRVRLTINTNTNLVLQTTEDADRLGCELVLSDGRLPLINGVRVAVLRDGFKTQWDHFEAIRSQIEPFQGSTFEQLRGLMAAASTTH
ncbi:hypothetical protein [Brevundimonas sp.]|uniref:hypothetical protein n=1 Tax=Brevundimonas sp. TaxID=1871086 RepID=UPI003D6C7A2E